MPMFKTLLTAGLLLSLPTLAVAADITGVPKIRDGDQLMIGSVKIRLGGIDAPSTDQLCLNTKGERWTCGVAARDELIKHAGHKSWTCHARSVDRRGRTIARCEVDGEDIQKWMVENGWALAFTRISHDYEPDEKAAREAKAGMWQGALRDRNDSTYQAVAEAIDKQDVVTVELLYSDQIGEQRTISRFGLVPYERTHEDGHTTVEWFA
ncbi:MAG: thermonuclease family protein, partial [Bradyrhizobium sp.]